MTFFRRFVSLALILCIAGLGLPLSAQAGMMSTETAIGSSTKDRIVSFLERGDVRAQMEKMGVNPADAKARVAAMTDNEAAQLAGQIDQMPAGADAGAVIGVIVLVALVLLITDLLGFTKIYPFTKPIR